jgi:hypothetical protein
MSPAAAPIFLVSAQVARFSGLADEFATVAGVIGAVALARWMTPRTGRIEMMLATWLAPLKILMIPRVNGPEHGVLGILLAAGFVCFTLPIGTHTDIAASLLAARASRKLVRPLSR